MSREIYLSSEFKRDLKRLKHQTLLVNEAMSVVNRLANDETLEAKFKDHALSGKFAGLRECHVRPDLLLVYKKEREMLILTCIRLGSHSEIFGR